MFIQEIVRLRQNLKRILDEALEDPNLAPDIKAYRARSETERMLWEIKETAPAEENDQSKKRVQEEDNAGTEEKKRKKR